MSLDTPLGLVIALGLLIAVVEILVHGVLLLFNVADVYPEFVDAVLLSIILSPVLYFLVFRTLQETEERLRVINATAEEAIVAVNEQGRVSDWNLAAQRIFQYSREEALGQQIHQLIAPPRYHADAARGLARFQETGESPLIGKTTEISALRKDGSEFPIKLSVAAFKLKGRWYATGIMRDITARKQAEESLRNSDARLRTVIENLTEGLAVSDLDGQLLHFNRAALDLHGFTTLDECRQHLSRFADTFELSAIDGTVLSLDQWPLARILRGESLRDLEVRVRHIQAGWQKVFSYGGTLVRDADGQPLMAIVTVSDITGRKLAEKESLEADILLKNALTDAIGAIAATLEQRDPYTAGHQRRVAQLAVAIGEEMGLAREVIEGIHFGGLIHDIGKISVPAEILAKPGRITDMEFALVKTHAEAGYEIVKDIAFPWPVAAIVRQHHERLDGSGYPQGLKEDQITLEARILAVADVLEAMVGNRPYRPGLGMDAALDEITRGRGTQFDPVAVDACLRVIKEKGFSFNQGVTIPAAH